MSRTTLLKRAGFAPVALRTLSPGDFFRDSDGDIAVFIQMNGEGDAIDALVFESQTSDDVPFSYDYVLDEMVTPLKATITVEG